MPRPMVIPGLKTWRAMVKRAPPFSAQKQDRENSWQGFARVIPGAPGTTFQAGTG